MNEEINGENRRVISLALGELDDVLGEMENKTEAEGSIKEG